MKRITLALFICVLSIGSVKAQYSMDFGLNLGAANYSGEVGGNQVTSQPWLLDMKLGQSRFGAGVYYRINFTRNLAAKIAFNYARIAGADSNSSIPSQRARNLSFQN